MSYIVELLSKCFLIALREGAKPQSSKPEPLSFAARAAAQQQQPPEKPPAPIAPEEVKQLVAGKEIAAGKEAAVQAELEAARLRTQLGLDERIAMFKKMLVDKSISVFSTFEKVTCCSLLISYNSFAKSFVLVYCIRVRSCLKHYAIVPLMYLFDLSCVDAQELSKIVFDARYLLLTSKERKSTFDEYCRERIADEKREKRVQLDQVRENFRKLLVEAKVHSRFVHILNRKLPYLVMFDL